MARYSPHTDLSRRELLAAIGAESIADLLKVIPPQLQVKQLNIPPGKSELEVRRILEGLANQNSHQAASFLGAGCYNHYIPAAVWAIVSRGEFLTSYTPYQPEAAQGTLQTIFEFQTGIARLMGLPIANASLYDGASATAEAVLMALRLQKKRSRILVADSLHPEYQELLTTYLAGLAVATTPLPTSPSGGCDLDQLTHWLSDDVAAVVIQSPNFYGIVEETGVIAEAVHATGALLIVVVTDPTTLAVLRSPGTMGADIVAGEGHSLGTPSSFGGPHLGLLGARSQYLRQIPGRLVSLTEDSRGQTAYTLTLQTREQHIRREKATSNVCTNQSLMAAAAAVYMALLGPEGLRQIALHGIKNSHELAARISQIPGYQLTYHGPFCHEFVVTCPRPTAEIITAGLAQNVFPGVPLDRWFPERSHELLICTTELTTPEDMQKLVELLV